MSKNKAKETVNQLTNFVNNYNCDEDAFIDAFMREHRTLQQSSFRLICKLIDALASDGYKVDGRNEGTKKVAKMLIEGFKGEVVKSELRAGASIDAAHNWANTKNTKPANYLGFI